jgi:hypothetical protein
MKRLYQVDPEQQKNIAAQTRVEIAREPSIAFAYLFGSFQENRPFHDIDIGIFFGEEGLPIQHEEVAFNLEQRLRSQVNMPVDVRILNSVPLTFLYHVLRGQLLLAQDEDLLSEVLERTIPRYLDMAPLLRHWTKEAFSG